MTTEVIQVVRIDFDELENRHPRTSQVLGVFVAKGPLTARGVASRWFAKQPPVSLYLGYDGQVYPQFQLKSVQRL
jgi:hypothetical protein